MTLGKYLSGKEEFEQEIPTAPAYEHWIINSKADDFLNLNDNTVEDQTTGYHQVQESESTEQPAR